ncbi:hypothetical protein [Vibrio furnissii]|uniref:hypothetical protein n=1 Tax=Vibrio furnissii TaxID=29494 RepID=UPI0023DB9017|nr:hypothetical protein [Vibrio furnissii]ELS8947703.1 hypothetical protein [Vibrio fluvialis]
MSWLDSLSEAGGELLGAVSEAGGKWINGTAENDVKKQQASNPDEARKEQVQGQTPDGRPITQAPAFQLTPVMIGAGVSLLLVVLVIVLKGGK